MELVECPNCTLPLERPKLIEQIRFPADIEAIASLVTGTFNSVLHLCGQRIHFFTPVVAIWRAERLFAVVGGQPPSNTRRSGEEQGWSFEVLDDYNELRTRVISWIQGSTTAFWKSVNDDTFLDLTPRAAVEAMDGVQLLAMKLVRDGVAVPFVETKDGDAAEAKEAPDWAREDINRIAFSLTALHLERVIQLAIFDGRGGDLEAAFLERMPVQCLDDALLAHLVEAAAVDWETLDLSAILPVYFRIIACAVAHRAAGRENPGAANLGALFIVLFGLQSDENVELDERLWLTPAQVRRLVPAETARQAAETVASGDSTGPVSPAAGEFLARMGWWDLYSELTASIVGQAVGSSRLLDKPGSWDVLVSTVIDSIDARRPIEGQEDFDNFWNYGELAANVCVQMLSLTTDESAQLALVRRTESALAETGSTATLLGYRYTVLQRANLTLQMPLMAYSAEALLRDVLGPDVPPASAVDVLNEVGNTFRYMQRWDESVRCYEVAAEFSEFTDDRARRAKVLARNRAIVYRESGRYSEARTILEDLVAANPDDAELLLSLLSLYERIGRLEDAVHRAGDAIARIELNPNLRQRFLLLRGELLARLGRQDQAAADCLTAWSSAAETDPHRVLCAAAALFTDPSDSQLVTLVDECEEEVVEALATTFGRYPPAAVTGGTAAALRRLRLGRVDDAGSLIAQLAALAEGRARLPWQFTFADGWYELERGSPQAFERLEAAVLEVEERFPSGPNAPFTIAALADVGVDELQRVATRAGIGYTVGKEGEAERMVAVVDLAHGRDLTGRAAAVLDIPDAGRDCLDRLDDWQEMTGADVVAVIDGADSVHLLVEPAGDRRRMVDTGVAVAELEAAVRQLRWFDRTNPCAPERTDHRLHAWWDLAGRLAQQIRAELPGESELIVIPGRHLLSTPVAAAGWPERPLIDGRPVSVAPNHRLLVGQDRRDIEDSRSPLGVVAVPRAQDSLEFREKLDDLVDELERVYPGVVALRNSDAVEAAVLEAWEQVRVLLLLCHGVHGGPVLGPGVCVAAGGVLPPSYLPVEKDPALGAFVLSWEDLLAAGRSPDVLVSIACASGRTSIGKGGSRLGLEQGSLATGTRFSIAPLWWVDQASSLAWVRAFIASADSQGVPALYQEVVSNIRKQFPHPYYWAPFTLSTALRGGKP